MKKMPLRRILAIAGLIIIVGLYALTIICSLIGTPFARSCLMASLFCTIVVPAVIYGFLIITKQTLGDNQRQMAEEETQGENPGQQKDEAQD